MIPYRLEWGTWEKVACWSTEAAISLQRVKIEEKLPCFYVDLPPIISGTGIGIKLRTSNNVRTIMHMLDQLQRRTTTVSSPPRCDHHLMAETSWSSNPPG